MTTSKTDTFTVGDFTFDVEQFEQAWKEHKPEMDYDPSIFPRRFKYDILLTLNQMKAKDGTEVSISTEESTSGTTDQGTSEESEVLESGPNT